MDRAARQKVDTRTTEVDVPPAQAFAPIRRIGGATGWYFGTWLWSVRSALDRLFGGTGMQRGRRDPEHCVEKDVIDGWTVETWETDRRLRLAAGLKLPGRGWLDFEVTPLDDGRRSRIRQTATFDPRGILGRAYWYAVLPIHGLMFRGMLRRIAERAERGDRPAGVSLFTRQALINGKTQRGSVATSGPNPSVRSIPLRRFVRI